MEYIIDTIDRYMGTFSFLIIDDKGCNHRKAYQPGDDISDLPEDILPQVEDIWTPEVMQNWKILREKQAELEQANAENAGQMGPVLSLEARLAKLEALIEELLNDKAQAVS